MFFKLLTSIKLKKLGATSVSIFGVIWLFLEPAGLLLPEWFKWGWWGYGGLIFLSLLIAIALNFPRFSVFRSLSSPNATIEIKIGDLFDEPGHLVIGTNDVFDTELGEVIKPSSVQGQFLTGVYHGDQKRLDAEIDIALEPFKADKKREPNKKKGKFWRYPIGTTLVLGSPDRRFFLNAYGFIGNDLKVKATADDIWYSLSCLWEKVRLKGHGLEVTIPIIGSDLARTNLPRMTLMKLIVISFIAASKKDFVTKKLTVVIHPKDLDSVDLYALEDFLDSTCF
ncbi:macro domain-containing protein [Nostoc sp.]|uniref:macro domain-containing protein n=1 Tax=Nostoc sp. TaxID=1180 RepID=UPI002FFC4FB6